MFQEEISRSSQVFFISQSERKNARFQRYMEDAHTIIPRLGGNDDTFSLLFMMVMEVITGLLLES